MPMIAVTTHESAEIISADASHVLAAWADLTEGGAAETLSELYDTSSGAAAVLVERARQVVECDYTAARDDSVGWPRLMGRVHQYLDRVDARMAQAVSVADLAAQRAAIRDDVTRAAALLIAVLDTMARSAGRDGVG